MSAYSLIGYCFSLIFTNLIYGKLYLIVASIRIFLTTCEYLLYAVYSVFFIGLFSLSFEFYFWYQFVRDPWRILTLYLEYD